MDWDSIPANSISESEVESLIGGDYEDDDNSTVSEALRRIEQAKLYESLIRHDFFAPGSARPEIQDKVTSEIRSFILERLSQLVGILPEKNKQQDISLPWSQDQVDALTSIADRLINKSSETPNKPNPVVNKFSSNKEIIPTKAKTNHTPQAQPQAKKPAQPASQLPPNMKTDPATGRPVSDNGVVLYQGQVPAKKAKKMPSQREIDMINQRQVQSNQAGSSIGSKMLNIAISTAQRVNQNVIEED